MSLRASLINNHVLASFIKSLQIVTHATPYEPVEEIRRYIEKKLRLTPLPFDGVSWKLWSSTFNRSTGALTLEIGPGRYSQYRFTNLDPELRDKYPDPTLWFNALALGALVITADNEIFFSRRPVNAYLSPGRLDIPCGHPSRIDGLPSNETLPIAIKMVVEKEIGGSVTIVKWKPLIHICMEPKWADDLVFVVRIAETMEDLKALQKDGRKVYHCDTSPDQIVAVLRFEPNLSRPVPLSLIYYLREYYGENWFLQFCQEKN